jgi:hypothetical protein
MAGFVVIPDSLSALGLDGNEKILVSYLLFLSRIEGFAWPSIETLAEKIGKSTATVYRYIRGLAEAGIVKIVKKFWRGRNRNVYYVNLPKKCAEKPSRDAQSDFGPEDSYRSDFGSPAPSRGRSVNQKPTQVETARQPAVYTGAYFPTGKAAHTAEKPMAISPQFRQSEAEPVNSVQVNTWPHDQKPLEFGYLPIESLSGPSLSVSVNQQPLSLGQIHPELGSPVVRHSLDDLLKGPSLSVSVNQQPLSVGQIHPELGSPVVRHSLDGLLKGTSLPVSVNQQPLSVGQIHPELGSPVVRHSLDGLFNGYQLPKPSAQSPQAFTLNNQPKKNFQENPLWLNIKKEAKEINSHWIINIFLDMTYADEFIIDNELIIRTNCDITRKMLVKDYSNDLNYILNAVSDKLSIEIPKLTFIDGFTQDQIDFEYQKEYINDRLNVIEDNNINLSSFSISKSLSADDKFNYDIKSLIKSNMDENDFTIFINPIKFDQNRNSILVQSSSIGLFINKWHFEIIKNAFKEVNGTDNVNILLMSKDEIYKWELKHCNSISNTNIDIHYDSLTVNKQFECIVNVYPVKKDLEGAKKEFIKLLRNNELPKISVIIDSIRNHISKDKWWREKYPPLLKNFLSRKGYNDIIQ